jgi:hypothetical protein
MKNFHLAAAVLFFCFQHATAQDVRNKYGLNVQSVDSIVKSIYAVISGEKGEQRDWEMMRHLFHPKANMVVNYINQEGEPLIGFLSPEDYIQHYTPIMESRDLFEQEVHREIQKFGNMVHVLSTFRTFVKKDDPEPFKQGIISIQLFNDGDRWWVINMYWKNEDPNTAIPAEYLPK